MSTTQKTQSSEEVQNTVRMIGDAHVLGIVSSLAKSPMRFCELQRSVNDLNPTTLTDRLKRLEKENIVARKEETVDKVSVTYALTDKGRGMMPIITSIEKFAKRYA